MTNEQIRALADRVATVDRGQGAECDAGIARLAEEVIREAMAPVEALLEELVEMAQRHLDEGGWHTSRRLQTAIDRARGVLP